MICRECKCEFEPADDMPECQFCSDCRKDYGKRMRDLESRRYGHRIVRDKYGERLREGFKMLGDDNYE